MQDSQSKSSSVLLTGASGFVGQRLLSSLRADGLGLRVIGRATVEGVEFMRCDFQSEGLPEGVMDGIDTVYHLAGVAHDLRDASEIEGVYQRVNVEMTQQLLERAVQAGVSRFIFVSSVKAGGAPEAGRCVTEADQGEPEGIYGRTKREAELKVLEMGANSSMHVSVVRPSLVYGPGVKGNLRMMLNGIEKGWFPPLPRTTNRRSMVHVDDLVGALRFVAGHDSTNGEIFIATDGRPYSSRDIYDALCLVAGKRVPGWAVPRLAFDLLGLLGAGVRYKLGKLLGDECYSSEKLQSKGFVPQRDLSDLNETVF